MVEEESIVPDPSGSPGFSWRRGRTIPWRELTFRQDAAGGPGGQHANRSATRVTLSWALLDSDAFSEQEVERLRAALAPRLSAEGIVQIRSSEERSARRNREHCLEIFAELLRNALSPRRTRRPTKPTRASKERRLRQKRKRSQRKESRRPPNED